MNVVYNEIDWQAVAWLRELIAEGLIEPGIVDERSIVDLRPGDCTERMHFFAGIGGWPYALALAGYPTDASVWTGSCPCQPFSCAGKRRGTADERHLWPVWRELIRECRPATVFGEQVASRDGREWLAGVRADLEAMGYAVGAADLCAAGVGAPHIRQRLFWVGHAEREWGLRKPEYAGQPGSSGLQPRGPSQGGPWAWAGVWLAGGIRRRIEPGTSPLAHGFPGRLGLLRGYGNAIVPQVAAAFVKACRLPKYQ
jgi:DNA (cytosine-5)-methyltransferase 1